MSMEWQTEQAFNKNIRGYICNDKAFHVCGYMGNKVLIQNTDISKKVHSLKLHFSSKGGFFTFEGKRVYINDKVLF